MDEDDKDLRLDDDMMDEPTLDDMGDEGEEDLNVDLDSVTYDEVSDDSVKLYLREIGKIPLLSSEVRIGSKNYSWYTKRAEES